MVISKEKQKALYFPLTFQKQLFEKRKGELEDAHKKGLYKTKEDADYIISRFWDVISENGTKYYLFRQSAIDIANRLKFDHKKFDASFLSVIPNGKKVTFLMGDVFFRWHKNENDIVVMGCAYDKIDPKRKEVDVKWYFFTINLVEDAYSYPPNPEPPFTENTWIDFMKLILFTELSELEDDSMFCNEILDEIKQVLITLGCSCGPDSHKATPPMFYREWLLCVVGKRERRIKELETELKMLQDFIHGGQF